MATKASGGTALAKASGFEEGLGEFGLWLAFCRASNFSEFWLNGKC
jgi:hypothetical protein